MSTSKQNRSKRRVRRARNKRLRQFPITVDIETRLGAMELGTRLHQEIERVMGGAMPRDNILSGHYHIGDSHIGLGHEQLMAYATMMPVDLPVMVIHGGDLVHDLSPQRPDGLVNLKDGLYAFDYKLANEVLDDFMRSVVRAVETKKEDKP